MFFGEACNTLSIAPDACLTLPLLLQFIEKDAKLNEMHAAAELFEPRVEYAFSYLQVFSAICVIFSHGDAPFTVFCSSSTQLLFSSCMCSPCGTTSGKQCVEPSAS